MTWLELYSFLHKNVNSPTSEIDLNRDVVVYDYETDSFHMCDTYFMPDSVEYSEDLILGINMLGEEKE